MIPMVMADEDGIDSIVGSYSGKQGLFHFFR